ncbi:hypothetical protein DPMN_113036 [Dreissena polymorpha]|uniref:EF-hand domain-containing protein n=2 Tax=Dreissena polymorpha TaxID=45954 RepID=A0A9D4KHI9_DREPO|nr:hypothetical protein DPMN_113036 [Dreissena polymorpha]
MNITDEMIHEVFMSFDNDGSGTLSRPELGRALNLLGIDLTEEELTDTYRIDDDPDSLTEEEFRLYIRDRIGNIDFKERTKECFQEFIETEDPERRLISRDSLKIILTQRGTNPIDDKQADEFLNEFDTNGDGMYDIQEITEIMYAMEDQPPLY